MIVHYISVRKSGELLILSVLSTGSVTVSNIRPAFEPIFCCLILRALVEATFAEICHNVSFLSDSEDHEGIGLLFADLRMFSEVVHH